MVIQNRPIAALRMTLEDKESEISIPFDPTNNAEEILSV